MSRLSFALAAVVLAGCGSSTSTTGAAGSPEPRDGDRDRDRASGEAIVQQMHDRYDGKWYRTLTFVQKSSFADGRVETWYEAAEIPGKLRIDVAPVDSGKTILFRGDSIYQFQGGKLAGSQALVHPLMVLGFDVYRAPVDETIAKLRGLGVNLDVVHETSWQGRPTYVVGAAEGDTTSTQFWIDKDRLVFVRLLEQKRNRNKPDAPAVLQETQFNRYEQLGDGWIAPEVVFKVNGKDYLLEEYSDVRADPPLAPGLFDPSNYTRPEWVAESASRR